MSSISSRDGLRLLKKWHSDNSVVLLETFTPSAKQRREFLVTIASILEGNQSTVLEARTIDRPRFSFAIDLTNSDFFLEDTILRTVAANGDEIAFSLSTG